MAEEEGVTVELHVHRSVIHRGDNEGGINLQLHLSPTMSVDQRMSVRRMISRGLLDIIVVDGNEQDPLMADRAALAAEIVAEIVAADDIKARKALKMRVGVCTLVILGFGIVGYVYGEEIKEFKKNVDTGLKAFRGIAKSIADLNVSIERMATTVAKVGALFSVRS